MYYVLVNRSNPQFVVSGKNVGRESDMEKTMQWPPELGVPQEQCLIVPKAMTPGWSVVTTQKKTDSKQVLSIPEGESVLDAFSDKLLEHDPDVFDRYDEEGVEALYAGGEYEDDEVIVALERNAPTLCGLSLQGRPDEPADVLHVPMYTLSQLTTAKERGVFSGDYTIVDIDTFIDHHREQIVDLYIGCSTAPTALEPSEQDEITTWLNHDGLSDKQKRDELIPMLEKFMHRAPTSREVDNIIEGNVAEFVFHASPEEARHVFLENAASQSALGMAELSKRHINRHNTVSAYAAVGQVLQDKVAHSPEPAVTCMALAGHLRCALAGERILKGGVTRFDTLYDTIADTHLSPLRTDPLQALPARVRNTLAREGYTSVAALSSLVLGASALPPEAVKALPNMGASGYGALSAWANGEDVKGFAHVHDVSKEYSIETMMRTASASGQIIKEPYQVAAALYEKLVEVDESVSRPMMIMMSMQAVNALANGNESALLARAASSAVSFSAQPNVMNPPQHTELVRPRR